MKRTAAIFAIFALLNLLGCAGQTYEEAVMEDTRRELRRIDDNSK